MTASRHGALAISSTMLLSESLIILPLSDSLFKAVEAFALVEPANQRLTACRRSEVAGEKHNLVHRLSIVGEHGLDSGVDTADQPVQVVPHPGYGVDVAFVRCAFREE